VHALVTEARASLDKLGPLQQLPRVSTFNTYVNDTLVVTK
jgi:hypothetical protein